MCNVAPTDKLELFERAAGAPPAAPQARTRPPAMQQQQQQVQQQVASAPALADPQAPVQQIPWGATPSEQQQRQSQPQQPQIPWGQASQQRAVEQEQTQQQQQQQIPWGRAPQHDDQHAGQAEAQQGRIPWPEPSKGRAPGEAVVASVAATEATADAEAALPPPAAPLRTAADRRIGRAVHVFDEGALVSATAAAERDAEPDDSFFEFTQEDLAKSMRRDTGPKYLMTAKMREQAMVEKASRLGATRVRVVMPDRTCVMADFAPLDTLADLHEFAAGILEPGTAFELFVAPPRRVLAVSGATLYAEGLCPAAAVRVTSTDGAPLSLRADVRECAGPPPPPPQASAAEGKRQRTAGSSGAGGSGSARSVGGGSHAGRAGGGAGAGAKKGVPKWLKLGK